jgi:hypothetical protein
MLSDDDLAMFDGMVLTDDSASDCSEESEGGDYDLTQLPTEHSDTGLQKRYKAVKCAEHIGSVVCRDYKDWCSRDVGRATSPEGRADLCEQSCLSIMGMPNWHMLTIEDVERLGAQFGCKDGFLKAWCSAVPGIRDTHWISAYCEICSKPRSEGGCGTPRRKTLCMAVLARAHHMQTAYTQLCSNYAQMDRPAVASWSDETMAAAREHCAERGRYFRSLTRSVDDVVQSQGVYGTHYPGDLSRCADVVHEVRGHAYREMQRAGARVFTDVVPPRATFSAAAAQGVELTVRDTSPLDPVVCTLLSAHDPDTTDVFDGTSLILPQYLTGDLHIGGERTLLSVLQYSGTAPRTGQPAQLG